MRYRPTLDLWTLSPDARAALPIGQWVSAGAPDASRANCGRWCGVTRGGSEVVAWNGNARKHASPAAYRHLLRTYAKGGRD